MARRIRVRDFPSLVGEEIGVTDWVPIDQARVNLFADATDDWQWIHVDTARATREWGGTIAHGFLTMSMAPIMAEKLLDIADLKNTINYGVNRSRFTAAVPVGRRIRVRQKLLSAEPRGAGMQAVSEYTVELEGSERPALVMEHVVVHYPREPGDRA